jgi:hypothetical protein
MGSSVLKAYFLSMRFVFHLTGANFIGFDVLPLRTDLLYQIIFGVRFF